MDSKRQTETSGALLQAARRNIIWRDVCPHCVEFLCALLSAVACELDLDLCHFDVNQAFVQSHLDEDVFLGLLKGCSELSDKVVQLNKSFYGLKQPSSRTWHAHLTMCREKISFEYCISDVCVFRLIENGRVSITAVVHVYDIFVVGPKNKCDALYDDLNRQIPVENLGELKWYGGNIVPSPSETWFRGMSVGGSFRRV